MKKMIRLSIINMLSIVVLLALYCETAWGGGDLKIEGSLRVTSNLTVNSVQLVVTNGNVGVGTNVPAARLHVNGNTIVESNLTVNGTISGNGSGITGIPASALPSQVILNNSPGMYNISVSNAASLGNVSSAEYLRRDGSVSVTGALTVGGITFSNQNALLNPMTIGLLSAIPTNDLMLYYSFDNDSGTNVMDSSGNGNNGYLVGSITYEAGRHGLAPRFSAPSTYIVSPSDSLNINGWPGMTLSVWVYSIELPLWEQWWGNENGLTTYSLVVERGGLTTEDNGGFMLRTPGYYGYPGSEFYVMTNATTQDRALVSDSVRLPLSVWTHYVVSCSPTNMRLYINGQLKSERAINLSSLLDVSNTKMVIGTSARMPYINWTDEFFNGKIDELLIYRRMLTDTEIQVLFNNAPGDGTLHVPGNIAANNLLGNGAGISNIQLSALPPSVVTNGAPINTTTINLRYLGPAATLLARTNSGSRAWFCIASSSNGMNLAAGDLDGYIYTSTDGGVTWSQRTSSGERAWFGIASSVDGMKLAAAASGDFIYTSADGGVTWTQRASSGARNWLGIASSSDGMKLAATTDGGCIYTTTDGGATWTERNGSGARNWYGIASSTDGTKLAAAVYNSGYIYTSTDGGATWMERTSTGVQNWYTIASSADGLKLVAGVYGGFIYTSTDGGATWTQCSSCGSRAWTSAAISGDGTKIAAGVDGGYVYTSTDGGLTWKEDQLAGAHSWIGLASSSDGSKLAGATVNDYIHTTGLVIQEQTQAVNRENITLRSDDWTNTVAGMSAATVADGAAKGETAVQRAGDTMTGNLTVNGIIAGNGSGITNIPVAAIIGDIGVSFTNVPMMGDLQMGVYVNRP